ncbi:tail fiber assembly protein [Pectobacterium parmentieri]|uniref:tail fiber assembly protein n=1 Tax=Pectobacterium parmentieri TaxID=1905730 RepID=UPI0018DFA627|nr:tail fiber assembly protein [Pectobacterium parmentieri]MBI0549206.1 tail fiber assembly protein [Pectobacterium parmentieri]MBI0558226.1 tail fiber assembly protein [Pectobacterium parmentieri]MBI0562278.1 tail fiber assembly protein [Pectobacterium parmentieri]
MKSIYVFTSDYRSFASTADVVGKTILVQVSDDFVGGAKTYNAERNEWIDDPQYKPTQEDLILKAEFERLRLIDNAKAVMSGWMDDLQLGIIEENEKTSLADWREYIKNLKAIDTSVAPDIEWPSEPNNTVITIKNQMSMKINSW